MSRNTLKIELLPFARQLILSGDLDPVYLGVQACKFDRLESARWLIAYWCFYHSGVACHLCHFDGPVFWDKMLIAAANTVAAPNDIGRWPRGAERRHFRGNAAVDAVNALREQYSRPESMLEFLVGGRMSVVDVIQRAQRHRLFGPWISFKIADMIDALVKPVLQDDLAPFLYKTPADSIRYHSPNLPLSPRPRTDAELLRDAMLWLCGELSDLRVPHKPQVAVDYFVAETVWCKHLSHLHGFYPPGKDSREVREGVEKWAGVAECAERFLSGLPVAAHAGEGTVGGLF